MPKWRWIKPRWEMTLEPDACCIWGEDGDEIAQVFEHLGDEDPVPDMLRKARMMRVAPEMVDLLAKIIRRDTVAGVRPDIREILAYVEGSDDGK